MGKKLSYKKQIEKHADEYFKGLGIGMHQGLIGRTISFFEFSLSTNGLLEDDDITHSQKLVIPVEWAKDIQTLAVRVANIYGVKHIELVNYKRGHEYSFAFVGYKGDIHACYVSLKKLFEMVKDVRQAFINSKSKRMKPENKKKHADEFMDGWISTMAFYLRPTALTSDDYRDINE